MYSDTFIKNSEAEQKEHAEDREQQAEEFRAMMQNHENNTLLKLSVLCPFKRRNIVVDSKKILSRFIGNCATEKTAKR